MLAVSREAVAWGSFIFAPTDVHLAIEVMSPGSKTKDPSCVRRSMPRRVSRASGAWRTRTTRWWCTPSNCFPEGRVSPTGVHRHRVVVDKPFPIDIELPPVTW